MKSNIIYKKKSLSVLFSDKDFFTLYKTDALYYSLII